VPEKAIPVTADDDTVPLAITGTRPDVKITDTVSTQPLRLLQIVVAGAVSDYLTSNLSFDGTNWIADDITKIGWLMSFHDAWLDLWTSPIGANPRTAGLARTTRIDPSGNIGAGGTIFPAYPVDASGDINVSGAYRVRGTDGITQTSTPVVTGITTATLQYKDWAGSNVSATVVVAATTENRAYKGGIRTA
jgi:hypothetical protein